MSPGQRHERRYEPLLKIASGGTASVWVGTAAGALGFRQLVAIKRPHAHLADDPAFRAALVDEAKIAARLRHANAVDVRDVEVDADGIQLVMDWVEGASLSELIRAWVKEAPLRAAAVAVRIVLDACQGLDALHELAGDDDAPLGCVHRDVSPANVLVGLDGVGRITDFGLARPLLAVERTTSEGALRGKLGYMAPEYIRGKGFDRRVDVFAMGIVLWEALSRKRLFRGENDADTLDRVQTMTPPPLAFSAPWLGEAAAPLDALLSRALAKDPDARIATISAFADELEAIARMHDLLASHAEVREAFGSSLRSALEDRRRQVHAAMAATEGRDGPSPTSTGDSIRAQVLSSTEPIERERPIPRRRLVALGTAGAAGIAIASLAALPSGGPARATADLRTVASDVQSRTDDVRPRAEHAVAKLVAPPSARALAPTKPGPTPASSTRASDEPGVKAPRPNPYAGH